MTSVTFPPAAVKSKVLAPLHRYEKRLKSYMCYKKNIISLAANKCLICQDINDIYLIQLNFFSGYIRNEKLCYIHPSLYRIWSTTLRLYIFVLFDCILSRPRTYVRGMFGMLYAYFPIVGQRTSTSLPLQCSTHRQDIHECKCDRTSIPCVRWKRNWMDLPNS